MSAGASRRGRRRQSRSAGRRWSQLAVAVRSIHNRFEKWVRIAVHCQREAGNTVHASRSTRLWLLPLLAWMPYL
jgi:hypothetical protein